MKDILITQQKIKTWQQEKTKLEASIRADQERLSLLVRRLESLSLYVDRGDQIPLSESVSVQSIETTGQSVSVLSPPAAVRAILKLVDKPISAAEIKGELKKAGYPSNKFGKTFAYLYTVLGRMVEGGHVTKADGKYKLA